jgi:acetoin utilization protein AcuB
MFVEQIMQRNVITLSPTTTLGEAVEILKRHRVRHFPVVVEEEVVGIVSDRDLRDACPSILEPFPDRNILTVPVQNIMNRNVITVHPHDFIEEAGYLMQKNRIGCVPVVRNKKLVGILSQGDVLHTLIGMMGVQAPSSRLEIEVPNDAESLATITQILLERHLKISSMLMIPTNNPHTRRIILRVQTINPSKLIDALQEKGYKVFGPPIL